MLSNHLISFGFETVEILSYLIIAHGDQLIHNCIHLIHAVLVLHMLVIIYCQLPRQNPSRAKAILDGIIAQKLIL